MDINDINETIAKLENSDTTFENCRKLAALYVVRDNLVVDNVEKELSDILPCYQQYVTVKRDFQMGKATNERLISAMESVCKEITEFIDSLYCNTELLKERKSIERTIEQLSDKYSKTPS